MGLYAGNMVIVVLLLPLMVISQSHYYKAECTGCVRYISSYNYTNERSKHPLQAISIVIHRVLDVGIG